MANDKTATARPRDKTTHDWVINADLCPDGGRFGWNLDKGAGRPEWLITIRESDEHNMLMFDAMRDQTYQLLRHLPFVEEIRNAGLDVMDAKGSYVLTAQDGSQIAIPVRRIRRGRTTVLVFRHGPAVHLWCMASAAKINSDDRVNDFTWILMALIEEYRPRNVATANLSRVIRSLEQAGLLLHSMVGNVDAIWHGSQKIALTGPEASVGKFTYNMLASFAAMERNSIMQRLMAGRIARYRLGWWVPGARRVPLGYKLDASTQQLVIDDSQRSLVEAVLRIIGDGRAPRAQLMALGKLGVKAPAARDENGERVSISKATQATTTMDMLMSWLSVWVNGEYLWRFTNPGLDMDELSGVPVSRWDDKDAGEFQAVVKVPVPEGGWASHTTLKRAVAVAASRWDGFVAGYGEMRPLHDTVADQLADPALARMHFRRMQRDTRGGLRKGNQSAATAKGAVPTGGAAREHVAPLIGRQWTCSGLVLRIGGLVGGKYRITAAVEEDL